MINIDASLSRFGTVLWISFLLGTIAPALVAARYHVFYRQDIEKEIVARQVVPASDVQHQKDILTERLTAVNLAIGLSIGANKNERADKALMARRNDILGELARLSDQIVVAPFFLNDLMVAWSAMYVALGVLMFVLLPKSDGHPAPMSWKLVFAVVAIYPFYQGPVWLRNFVLNNEQRKVYSFANHDICGPCFWMQEINTVIWLAAIALLWNTWFGLYRRRARELQKEAERPIDIRSLLRLRDMFLHWQVSSIVLALGFMVFTGVFWNLVIVDNDRRYLVPAVVVHLIWALSWMLMTLPLFATWQDFTRKKMQALLGHGPVEVDGRVEQPNREVFKELEPIALWNGFGSALTALLSFVFPIIHALAK